MKLHKRLFPYIIALAVVLICLFVLPIKAQAVSESDLMFTLNDDSESYCVSGCDPSASGELVIPAIYNSKPVTAIGSSAFKGYTELTSVTIPEVSSPLANLFFPAAAIWLPQFIAVTRHSGNPFLLAKTTKNYPVRCSITAV